MNTRNPSATGTKIEASPKAKIRVKYITFLLSLKIVPRYVGKRKVIQQGANNASTPAKKDAVSDMPNIKLVSISLHLQQLEM